MNTATQSVLKTVLRRSSWLLLGVAGLAFWEGGRAISEFTKVDRIMAEFLGLLIAVVTGIAGYLLKIRADDLEAEKEETSQRV